MAAIRGSGVSPRYVTRARYRVRALAKLHSASLPRSDRSPLALASCVTALRTTLVRARRYRAPAMSVRAAGGIFFSGSKAQRSEPFRK